MNEGHKFISLGYLVLPSLNKAFTYLLLTNQMRLIYQINQSDA